MKKAVDNKETKQSEAKPEKKETMGITAKKVGDFSDWYTQVVLKAELADYSAVSGCMVIRPLGYAIWEKIRQASEERLNKLGVKNAYFPLFIPEFLPFLAAFFAILPYKSRIRLDFKLILLAIGA